MKENMTLPPAPLSFWKRKLSWKQSLIIIITMVFLALLGQMVRGVKLTFDQMWKEGGFAYDVKAEYYVARFAGGGVRILTEKGWNQNGTVIRSLRWVHGIAYENAIKKIPDNDGEKALWYFDYRLYPVIQQNKINKVNIWMPQILETFRAIVHQPIKSDFMHKVERYDSARWLFNYYFNNKIYSNLSSLEKQQWERELIEDSLGLLRHVNIKYIVDSELFQLAPIRYGFSVLVVSFDRNSNLNFSCQKKNIGYYLDAKKLLTDIARRYKGVEHHLTTAQRQEMLQIAYKARDMNIILRQKLLENCQVDIQQLERQ